MAVKQVFNTSAELDYPTVLPTLDLDFANSKTLDPRITFTRASGGSYVGADGLIKYAGINEARFDHDPVTGESLGLLIEESRTNLFPYSEDFSQATWTTFGTVTISSNVATSPDGSFTADSITLSPFFCGVLDNIAASANTTYTFSSYIKGTPGTKIRILFNFNVSGVTSKIVTVSDVWQRFDVTATSGSSDVNVSVQYDNGELLGGGTFYVWGAQIEQGSFPTSYIPTQGSTRTRAADSASITGKNFSDFYRQDEGTVFVDVYNDPSLPTGIALNFSDFGNFGSNRIQMIRDGNVAYLVNNVVTLNNTSATSTNLLRYKLLTSYNLNDIVIAANGSYVTRPGKGAPPQNITTMTIGSYPGGYPGGASKINKSISRIIYFPKRLPNSQLQALTR